MAGDVFQQTGHPLPHPPLQWLPKMTKKSKNALAKVHSQATKHVSWFKGIRRYKQYIGPLSC